MATYQLLLTADNANKDTGLFVDPGWQPGGHPERHPPMLKAVGHPWERLCGFCGQTHKLARAYDSEPDNGGLRARPAWIAPPAPSDSSQPV